MEYALSHMPISMPDEFYGMLSKNSRVIVFDQKAAASENSLSDYYLAIRELFNEGCH